MRPRFTLRVALALCLAIVSSVAVLSPHAPVRAADQGWYVTSTITSKPVTKATFINDTTGWAVGDSGGLYLTKDGGQTWATKTTGINDDLFSISFPDAQNGYAVGANLILHTTDGGATWQQQRPALPNTLLSLSAPSATTVYVAANPQNGPSGVYKSTDSGATWTNVLTGTVHTVLFTTPSNGWAIGVSQDSSSANTVYHTTDGGITWKAALSGADSYAFISFVSPTTGFIATQNHYSTGWAIERTTDGGSTFTAYVAPTDSSGNGQPTAMSFLSGTQGLYLISGSIYATTDGGTTWVDQGRDASCDMYCPSMQDVGYRGTTPYAIEKDSGGSYFLHFGYPLPPPTATPMPPTDTPPASATPYPTNTTIPSSTPRPTNTTAPSNNLWC